MKHDVFCTSDLPLATTLISLGFTVSHLDRTDGQRVRFCFDRTEELDETVEFFWRGELRIEPKLFCLNQKLLKSRLHEHKRD